MALSRCPDTSPDERSVGDDDGDDFPLPREVSPAEQLCRSSRLDPPRFRLMAAEFHPERLLLIFFSSKDFIWEKMDVGEPPGGPRGRGARPVGRPHPREQGVAPLAFIFGDDFSLFILRYSVEFQDFWSCTEMSGPRLNATSI